MHIYVIVVETYFLWPCLGARRTRQVPRKTRFHQSDLDSSAGTHPAISESGKLFCYLRFNREGTQGSESLTPTARNCS